MARERIGIMGGTFNPIHTGHITMAKAAMTAAKLDRVLVIPAGVPPHKEGIAPAEDRWRMVCAATAQEPGLEPCRLELDRGGTTYSVDTLQALKQQLPKAELYFIIGADTLMQLHNWRCFETVLKLCTFLVCPRTCDATPAEQDAERRRLTAMGGHFQSVDMEVITVSSTELREDLLHGKPTPLLPVPVQEYCCVMGLYGLPAHIPVAKEWMARLFGDLSYKRFAHTLAVAYMARVLARIHHVDMYHAELAGMLHDCAKCIPLKEMQRITKENGLTGDAEILASGNLLHSIAGAYLARVLYHVRDEDVLEAIACHTTGRAGMTRLDMVVYLADKTEPTRESYPTLDKVRMLSTLSLEKAMMASMEGTVNHVQKGDKKVHPQTMETLAWLKSHGSAKSIS